MADKGLVMDMPYGEEVHEIKIEKQSLKRRKATDENIPKQFLS